MNKAFNCKYCDKYYKPENNQYIFYGLCNECFVIYDTQKNGW